MSYGVLSVLFKFTVLFQLWSTVEMLMFYAQIVITFFKIISKRNYLNVNGIQAREI